SLMFTLRAEVPSLSLPRPLRMRSIPALFAGRWHSDCTKLRYFRFVQSQGAPMASGWWPRRHCATSRPNRRRTDRSHSRWQLTVQAREDRAVPAAMTNGPLVGGVTATAAEVWARTDAAASVAVQYSTDPNLAGAKTSAAIQTSAAHDFTAIVPITGLQPL